MKNLIIIVGLAAFPLIAQTKPDTLFFDPSTGNYIIKYIGDEDTLVTVVFEPATKINPLLVAEVRFSSKGDTLIYEYKVTNQKDGRQRLQYFELEYGADFIDETDNRWSRGKITTPVLEGNRIKNVETNRYLWAGGIGMGLGISAEGFRIKSVGLPAIVNAYFQGNVPMTPFPDGGPPPELDRQIAKLEVFPANRVIRKTIGPVVPPEPFISLAFLDTLVSYKHQAFALGWIKNQGIVQSLDAKLENAQAQLQRNNKTAARNILQAFVNEVEALWKQERPPYGGKQITSEAYALLKFNGEYLISKL
ncbi:MAG TPA: hypothetical protein VNL36_04385 [Bacteroidota bacterium]|nr:hypothetical protein [Bacteroidota bacterium]